MFNSAALLALLMCVSLPGQELHLKTRNFKPQVKTAARPTKTGHRIVQFDHAPGVEELNALTLAGFQPVAVVPDNAVLVTVTPAVQAADAPAGIQWVGEIDPADKLSPELGTDDSMTVVVEFHGDVTADVQDSVAAAEGVTFIRPAVLASHHAIVKGSMADLQALVAHDEVAYIFPADADLTTGNNVLMQCAGMLTQSGPVPQYANVVHGWDLDADHAAHLSYVFGTLTTKAPAATVQGEILRALNEWSKNANVIFYPGTNASAPRTIAIRFASGAHGDAYPFEGYGPVLAHTFFPSPLNPEPIAGDMHLNADENWHIGADIDIYSVALHEAGHALGLGHSDKPGDVMYPYYHHVTVLSANDIGAIQQLYGQVGATVTSSVTTPATGVTATTAAALRLTLDSAATTTQDITATLTGTIAGGTAPFTVQWQSDHGYSGQAAFTGPGLWKAAGMTLVTGVNTMTITVFDSAHRTATQTVSITRAPQTISANPSGVLSVAITSPASTVLTVTTPTVSLAGIAKGGSGVTKVIWQTSAGISGTAAGTDHWVASGIPVLTGTTSVIVRAIDAAGATAWTSMVAVH